jgi:hypothetical protein
MLWLGDTPPPPKSSNNFFSENVCKNLYVFWENNLGGGENLMEWEKGRKWVFWEIGR